MYPVLFRIGTFEVTSFGVMMAVATLVGVALFRSELRQAGLPNDAADAGIVGVIGGFVGAKLLWTLEHAGDGALTERLFSRGGLSWYGGLIGGVGAGLVYIIVRGWPIVPTLAAATPALAYGHLIGRIGCFLVGDDYGRPTDGWWGVAFPKGSPPTTAEALREFGVKLDPSIPAYQVLRVHPTQIYESLAAFVMFGILIWYTRREHRKGRGFALFLAMMGVERFLVEIVRAKDDRFIGPFTIAQLISTLLILAAVFLWSSNPERSEGSPVTPRRT